MIIWNIRSKVAGKQALVNDLSGIAITQIGGTNPETIRFANQDPIEYITRLLEDRERTFQFRPRLVDTIDKLSQRSCFNSLIPRESQLMKRRNFFHLTIDTSLKPNSEEKMSHRAGKSSRD